MRRPGTTKHPETLMNRSSSRRIIAALASICVSSLLLGTVLSLFDGQPLGALVVSAAHEAFAV
jgi:hypothetical protein